MSCHMRLLYRPTLFEASRIAAKQLLVLAYGVNLLPLSGTLKLAHSSL